MADTMSNFTQAARFEESLHNDYQMARRAFKHLGVKRLSCKMKHFQHRCHKNVNIILKRALFLGADEDGFRYQTDDCILKKDETIKSIFSGLLTQEEATVKAYQGFLKQAMDAGDDNTRNMYEHLIKWHEDEWKGGSGKGHIDYLKQQLNLIQMLGEQRYLATKV